MIIKKAIHLTMEESEVFLLLGSGKVLPLNFVRWRLLFGICSQHLPSGVRALAFASGALPRHCDCARHLPLSNAWALAYALRHSLSGVSSCLCSLPVFPIIAIALGASRPLLEISPTDTIGRVCSRIYWDDSKHEYRSDSRNDSPGHSRRTEHRPLSLL